MLVNRLIPVLLLQDQGLYKTVKFKKPVYVGDPRNAVKIFNEKEVDELCLLDIGASKESKEPDFDFIGELTNECFMPIAYGGGITSLDHIKRLFSLGVEKVVLNSVLFTQPDLVRDAAQIYGNQSIVASVDVKRTLFKKLEVRSVGGTKKENVDLPEFLKHLVSLGAGEVIINSIDKDGTMGGMDTDLIKLVADQLDIPVVACGGVGALEHIREGITTGGASAIGAGSFFVFHGKHRAVLITYPPRKEVRQILSI